MFYAWSSSISHIGSLIIMLNSFWDMLAYVFENLGLESYTENHERRENSQAIAENQWHEASPKLCGNETESMRVPHGVCI